MRLRREGRAAIISAATATAVLAGLGWTWARDRTHRWEPPRWEPSWFVAISGGEMGPESLERWVVPVNPDCPRCARDIRRVGRAPRPAGARVAVLIVDAPRPAGAEELHRFGVDEVWWDRDGIWRRRWGHRVYGEVLRFGRDGEFRGARSLETARPESVDQIPEGGGG
jgi:hypothetical protein